MRKTNLFSDQEAVDLIKYWKKYHTKKAYESDLDEFEYGVVTGLDFALSILERTGD